MVPDWLLCDFHIHTTFSDGSLPLENVVDLYGAHGFDVIAVTDHILDRKTLERYKTENLGPLSIERDCFSKYLETLWREARRAWEKYGLLLVPGVELTNNTDGYHILGIDIKDYIDPGLPVETIVNQIHAQSGIAIAPHPHRGHLDGTRQLMYLWNNHERFVHAFDAWEVANRDDLFNVVGLKKFNYIANSDFHERRHLFSWKTLIHCEKNTEAVKAEIRNNDGVSIYLFRENKHI